MWINIQLPFKKTLPTYFCAKFHLNTLKGSSHLSTEPARMLDITTHQMHSNTLYFSALKYKRLYVFPSSVLWRMIAAAFNFVNNQLGDEHRTG